MLDLRQLAVLRAIDRTGSLAAAARDLYLSQPTIAHHLDSLERSLGVTLVERGPRGTVLTDIGHVLLGHAEAVLDRLASAENEVRALGALGVATLRVGTFSSAGAGLLPAALAAVQQQTGVRVELQEAETPQLLDAMAEGTLNAALVYSDPDAPLSAPAGWQVTPLFVDQLLLALPASHHLADQPSVPLGDLAEDGWILARQQDDPADLALLAAAARQGFVPRVVLRTDDFQVANGFVAAGVGVALIPEIAAEPRPGLVLRPIAGETLARSIDLARPVDATPVVRLLEEELLAVARHRSERARG